MSCLVLGAGSWGAAVANIVASKGVRVHLWCRREERAVEIRSRKHGFLPGCRLSELVEPFVTAQAVEALRGEQIRFVVAGVPTQHIASVLEANRSWLPGGLPWVSLAKGLELATFRLPSTILEESRIPSNVAVLSGPSLAEEVALGMPTAVVLGYRGSDLGRNLQGELSSERFRVYFNEDRTGVELGGALKNITAIAAGIAVGQGFGHNTIAALVVRGGVEMARLGVVLGGRRETFAGLSGIGDLMVTCFSPHSRNRSFGERVGRGESPTAVLAGTKQAVEGVATTQAVVDLCSRTRTSMPIAEEVNRILRDGKEARAGVEALLQRSLKEE